MEKYASFFYYRNDPKFSDRYAWANNAVQDQSALIRVYTVCHSVCIVWTHYSMVESYRSNFRVITTNVFGVRILVNLRYDSFKLFVVNETHTVCIGNPLIWHWFTVVFVYLKNVHCWFVIVLLSLFIWKKSPLLIWLWFTVVFDYLKKVLCWFDIDLLLPLLFEKSPLLIWHWFTVVFVHLKKVLCWFDIDLLLSLFIWKKSPLLIWLWFTVLIVYLKNVLCYLTLIYCCFCLFEKKVLRWFDIDLLLSLFIWKKSTVDLTLVYCCLCLFVKSPSLIWQWMTVVFVYLKKSPPLIWLRFTLVIGIHFSTYSLS